MARTTTRRRQPDLYAQAVRDLEPLTPLRDFYDLSDHFAQDELEALVKAEYARYTKHGELHPEDQPYFRMVATVAVGYRLGLQVMRGLLAGGVR